MLRGRAYERELDVRAAVQCFDEAAKLSPANLLSLCMAAKQWSDLTFYHDVRSDRERQLVNLKAVEYAARAVAAHPLHPGGHLSTCISKGRLALFTDNRSKVRLAKEAQDAARTALALAPDNDLAHHLMGRWHYEMARVPGVVRAVVRMVYGTALQPGTREEALAEYRLAAALAPGRLVHRAEAGRVLLELGQPEAARAELAAALRCEVEDINAWHTRHDAEMLLAQIERRPWRRPSVVPPARRAAGAAPPLSTAALLGVPEGSVGGPPAAAA
jgi:tetratricopeptide (TPR) repeat protein